MKPFDASGAYRLAAQRGELRRLAVRAAGVTVLSQGSAFAVQMIATVILARLLTPADFGLVTMVTTFSLLLTSFGLNGFTEAVLRADEIDHLLVSNLFWINVSAGLLLTIAFAAAGSLMAGFYGEPRVAHVAVGMSVTIFITSTSVLHLALLQRAMRFAEVSVNDILARGVSVAVSILLGWAGWGYWALVGGAVAQPLTTSIGAWALCQWVPGLPRRVAGTAPMVRFAMNIYSHFTVNYVAGNLDNLLVGWRFDALSLGFYKKAYDLFVLPANQLLSPIAAVVISTLSRLNRDTVQYRRYFLSGLSILAFVGMGVGADLTLVGKDLIRLLLGPGWEASGRIFTFFGPGIGVMLIYSTHGWIHLSIGRADRWFRWGLIEVTVAGLLFVLALPWGPVGIAVAWTASFWILTIPAFWYAGRPIHFGIAQVIAVVWKYLFASALAGCTSAVVIQGIPSLVAASGWAGAVARIFTISLLFSALYIGAVILLHGGCEPLYQVARLSSDIVPWGSFSRWAPAVAGTRGSSKSVTLTTEETSLSQGR